MTTKWKKLEHIFLVRGHSYIPPDQMFGHVEKELHRNEVLLTPGDYHKIFQNHRTNEKKK